MGVLLTMNKLEKIWIVSLFSITAIVLVLGFFVKLNFKDSGLSEIKKFKDLDTSDIRIENPLGLVNEELIYNQYANHQNEIIEILSNSSIIAIVTPTGNLDIGEGSLGQEFIVNESIKGNVANGEKGTFYLFSGFNVNERLKINYNEIVNLMNPQHKYLLFLEESQLNSYTKSRYFKSIVPPSYFCLSESTSTLVSKNDKLLSSYKNSEFFVNSPRILTELYKLKETVLNMYLN